MFQIGSSYILQAQICMERIFYIEGIGNEPITPDTTDYDRESMSFWLGRKREFPAIRLFL